MPATIKNKSNEYLSSGAKLQEKTSEPKQVTVFSVSKNKPKPKECATLYSSFPAGRRPTSSRH